MQFPHLYSPYKRNVLKVLILALVLVCLICASTVPFLWESKSLWYKLGIDKTLLQLGKVAGLWAAVFLYLQIILALKIKILDRILGLDRVYYIHQLNGYLILCLVVIHVSLVLIPEGINNLPIGWKFWPEIVGAAAFLLLIGIVISARFRRALLSYHVWRRFHRPLGYILVVIISIHILYVSDSFENTVPKYVLFGVVGCVILAILWFKIKYLINLRRYFDIEEIVPVTDDIVSIHLTSPQPFSYAPGQFAFLRFSGHQISSEPHPFTIASAPGYNDTLQFYIKKSGDWTADITSLSQGSPTVHGPFGLFSYKTRNTAKDLIFIAAGIGITPMLSMLREISQHSNPPEILLIWSMRYHTEMFLEHEFTELRKTLPKLTTYCVYTREDGGKRITKELLEELLMEKSKDSHIYICGPENMMKSSRDALVALGYSRNNIFWERFTL